MITKADIVAALQAHWEEKDGSNPINHGAVRALLDKAEMADAVRARVLTMALRSTPDDVTDQVAAVIHGAVCDMADHNCVDAERLDTAARAVVQLVVSMQLGGRHFEPPSRPSLAPKINAEQIVAAMEAIGRATRDAGSTLKQAFADFNRQVDEIWADVNRVKVRIAFADQAPDIRRVAFDRDGAEWRKIDESRWASLAWPGRYLTLADLESSLGPLSDNRPPS